MKKLTKELEQLDLILTKLAGSEQYGIAENELKKFKHYSSKRLAFLIDEKLISKSDSPIYFQLTQKGIVFTAKGGFQKENKMQIFFKNSNLIYLIATPIMAMISVSISIFTLFYSKQAEIDVTNNNDNIIDSHWQKRDTTLNNIELIEQYKYNKSDTTIVNEMVKRQTITKAKCNAEASK